MHEEEYCDRDGIDGEVDNDDEVGDKYKMR